MDTSIKNLILTDNELVSLSLENQEYFGVLVERYEGKLSRYIRRITNVPIEDQEDILQNIFLKTYLNLNGFNKKLSFNSWVYRIAHNEIIDWSRREKIRIKYGKFDFEDEIFDWTADGQHFLQEFHALESQAEIGNILLQLEIKYREALVLKFIEGYSYREISDILKKPEGTIATLINRAKKSFKEHYEKSIKQ